MSTTFTYGGVRADDLAGVEGRLTEWPSLGGLELQVSDASGRNGRFYSGATRGVLQVVFEVLITGESAEQTYQRRDMLIAALDPHRGPRDLVIEGDEDWILPEVVVAEEINWERVIWRAGSPLSLRGDVVFETTRIASAREADPQVVSFTGTEAVTLEAGNTSTQPRMMITPHSDEDELTVTVGSFELRVERFSYWTGSHSLVLDWEQMSFYLADDAGRKVASAVPAMSRYDWPTLHPGETVTVEVTPSRPVEFYPNARRI